jgi:hypothetical protein
MALLSKRTNRNEPEAAARLAKLLDDLPLAVAQAAAFIEINRKSISAYLELYNDPRIARQLRMEGLESTEYPASVAVTWLLHFRQLKRVCPAAVSLLRLCAFLDPDNIALETLGIEEGGAGRRLAKAMKSPWRRVKTLGLLAQTSLISIADDQTIQIHRLVQTVTRDQLNKIETAIWVRRTLRLIAITSRKQGLKLDLAPHVSAVLEHSRDYWYLARLRRSLIPTWNIFEAEVLARPYRLLDPRLQAVPFIGRENELTFLTTWCMSSLAAPLQLVTGPRGVGKTRLAVELSARLTEQGWRCVRVAEGMESVAIDMLRVVTRGHSLLIVDYAEASVGLKHMLHALSTSRNDDLRVLLLARSAGGWWEHLGADGTPGVQNLVQQASLTRLVLPPTLSANLSESDILSEAAHSFARYLGVATPSNIGLVREKGSGLRILDIQMLALAVALREIDTKSAEIDFALFLEELLRHEQHVWFTTASASGLMHSVHGMSMSSLRQVIAAGCLLGAATEQEAIALTGRVPGLSPSARIARWLREMYPPAPGDPNWFGSILPDLLSDIFTVKELQASSEFAEACLTGLSAEQAQRAVTLLARASGEHLAARALLSRARISNAAVLPVSQTPPDATG